MKHKMSQTFFIRKTRPNKDGSITIMARITINHKTLDFTTGINIHTPELWNPTLNRMNTKRTQAIETNNTLAFIEKKLEATYTTLYQTNTHVTVEMVRDAFHGKNQDQYTLLTLFDKLIKQKKALAKTIITQDTVEKYQCTKKKVQHYLQTTYKQKDIHIKEVNYDFIHNYEIYLLSDGGCGHNTMVRHMRYLKQVITDALKCNYITRAPFYNITLSSKRTNPKYLTETELAKILHTPFQNKILEQTRDIFIFCSLTGLSYYRRKTPDTPAYHNRSERQRIHHQRPKENRQPILYTLALTSKTNY